MTLRVDVALPALDSASRSEALTGAGVPAARPLAALLRRAILATLRAEAVGGAEISVTALDDPAMRELNRDWLGHDRTTDVIAFPLSGDAEILGDIYIGVERAAAQAAELDVPVREELIRLAVHGTLHVLGHDHPDGAERQQSDMWRRQERIVNQILESES